MIGWILTTLAVTGAIFNMQRRVEGFYLWIVANVGFLTLSLQRSDYAQAVLWAVYTLISLNGIRVWWKKDDDGDSDTPLTGRDGPEHPNCRCAIVPIQKKNKRDEETLREIGAEMCEAKRRADILWGGSDEEPVEEIRFTPGHRMRVSDVYIGSNVDEENEGGR